MVSALMRSVILKEEPQGYAKSKRVKICAIFDKHMNVKGIQPLLEELKENTFSKYDIMTVGEANGVKIEDAELWVGEEQGKFNMVFQFEHLSLWDAEKKKDLDVVGLKKY